MTYLRPRSVEAALQALATGARVLAGGTDLYPGAATQLSGPVVDLGAIPELRGIRETPTGFRIGAATTWTEVAEAGLPPAFRALQQAALQVGGRQIQNVGTLGGNLCNASPAADGVPPLLALEAEVELLSLQGVRRLALADFLLGPRRTALQGGELLVAVHLPAGGLDGVSSFVKLGARAYLVISIAMAAVRLVLSDGRIERATVVVGACSPVARRLARVEAGLTGSVEGALDRIDPDVVAEALDPIDDVRASAAYRRKAATELIRRAVAEVLA
jgi:CO/xanthine dehydrogenase FAD-binding subunit